MKSQITELGRYLRAYRLDNNMLLKDMAYELRITPSYLSSLEKGKRRFSTKVFNKVISKYGTDTHKKYNIESAYYKDMGYILIDVTMASNEHIALALDFKDKLIYLNERRVREIAKALS